MAGATPSSRKLNTVLQALAAESVRVANESCPARKKWTQAYLDVRYDADGFSVMKLRVLPAKGREIDPEDTTPLIDTAAAQLGRLRTKRGANKWYGVRVTVTPAGQWRADYNQDPDGAEKLLIYNE
jgi:hypothetical protein